MYIWPEDMLPLPSVNYSSATHANVIREEMESGFVSQAKRFSVERNLTSVTFYFTNFQKFYFQSVYRNKLSQGNDQFLMPLFVNDQRVQSTVKFTSGGYQTTYNSGVWEISAELETLDVPVLTSEEIDALS